MAELRVCCEAKCGNPAGCILALSLLCHQAVICVLLFTVHYGVDECIITSREWNGWDEVGSMHVSTLLDSLVIDSAD